MITENPVQVARVLDQVKLDRSGQDSILKVDDRPVLSIRGADRLDLSHEQQQGKVSGSGVVTLELLTPSWPVRQDPKRPTPILQGGTPGARSGLDNALYAPQVQMMLQTPLDWQWKADSQRWSAQVDLAKMPLQFKTQVMGKEIAGYLGDRLPPQVGQVPAGWCSWYEYYTSIDAEGVRINADFVEKNLKSAGYDTIQIDDGWQLSPGGDWEANEKFPDGMKALADEIKAKGLKAGIWLHPLMVHKDSQLYKDHPDWILREDGKPVYPWTPDIYALDPAKPEVRDFLTNTLKKANHDWGYSYLKLDNIWGNMWSNQKNTEAIATYRETLKEWAESLEPGSYVAGRALPMPPHFASGYFPSMRNHSDVYADWRGIQPNVEELAKHYWLHNTLWITDPDTVVARPPLTLDQARVWAATVAMSGGVLMLGDRLDTLPSDRVALAKQLAPVMETLPKDLFPHNKPEVWVNHIHREHGDWAVAAYYNWSDKPKTVALDRAALGLKGPHLGFDLWNNRVISTEPTSVTLPPTSAMMVRFTPVKDEPQVIGSDRHISQGGVELADVQWQDEHLSIQAKNLIPGDPWRVTLSIPLGFQYPASWGEGWQAETLAPGIVQLTTIPKSAELNARWHFHKS